MDAEDGKFIITIGNHLATEEKFESAKAAQRYIESKSWDLIMSMVFACIEANEAQKNSTTTNEEEKK
ncbi:hypothetical protein [Microvirus mar49]|uniref:Uncharacterized protein n=1 Tax=Microvirus mar49 TaxID=2851184 RepID=A0A8F6AI48_9VIRU|nr:hypothetical protein [Microvirus mar49]